MQRHEVLQWPESSVGAREHFTRLALFSERSGVGYIYIDTEQSNTHWDADRRACKLAVSEHQSSPMMMHHRPCPRFANANTNFPRGSIQVDRRSLQTCHEQESTRPYPYRSSALKR
uniref:Uncharacterized protein n=1 Tax=Vespula pensylvanica TaxID=30213 RepID=A0A834N430_VESPE|nr:hypothetical protein H0235_016829 [Vespula pensylvanica]